MSGGKRGRFEDRTHGGERLVRALRERGVKPDVVLAIPRGGLPVGRVVADALGVPLDVVVAAKIPAPDNPEFAIGAAGSDGTVWLDEALVERLGIGDSYVESARERTIEKAREKALRYRGQETEPDVDGKTVLVVDDGVATGATATAAIRVARQQGAREVVLGVPVGSPDTVRTLADVADSVVTVLEPPNFNAVGQFYDTFDQVSDETAIALLERDS